MHGNSKNRTLVIFSGLPGSGKSTLASALASRISATYLRIDTIEQGLRDICEISQLDGKGYQLAHRIARENLQLGTTVIADSVNPWGLTRKEWNKVAEEIGASFINVEVVCSDRDEHQRRVDGRKSSISGLKLPAWKDVVERDYHAWDEDRFIIDTAGKNEDASLAELLGILGEEGLKFTLSNSKSAFSVKRVTPSDKSWVASLKDRYFSGAEFIVTRGRKVYPTEMSGFYAEDMDGERVGYIGYEVQDNSCEIVTLDAFTKYLGIGTALTNAVIDEARSQRCRRIWLITTNDNLDAIRFYQKRGFVISKIHTDSIAASRKLKPSIPLTGNFGIPIRDEIEMEVIL